MVAAWAEKTALYVTVVLQEPSFTLGVASYNPDSRQVNCPEDTLG